MQRIEITFTLADNNYWFSIINHKVKRARQAKKMK
jgi:hypothetical protein